MRKMWLFSSLMSVFIIISCVFAQAAEATWPTLLLDPGHGGEDGGAVACDGTIEASINWDISNRCKVLAEFLGAPVQMTRDSYDIQYPESAKTVKARKTADQKSRAALVNSGDPVILISIHQNKFTSEKPFGPQVFYNTQSPAQLMAERLQKELNEQLCPDSRRLAAPVSEDVWLMRQATRPALLVECGFLSHPQETARLQTEEYQRELSLLIIGCCIQEIQGVEEPDEIEDSFLLHGLWQ